MDILALLRYLLDLCDLEIVVDADEGRHGRRVNMMVLNDTEHVGVNAATEPHLDLVFVGVVVRNSRVSVRSEDEVRKVIQHGGVCHTVELG